MRIRIGVLVGFCLLGLGACARHDTYDTRDSAARKAGSAAYKIAEETKEAAKKAGTKLREAGREMHEGWKEAKQEDRPRDRK